MRFGAHEFIIAAMACGLSAWTAAAQEGKAGRQEMFERVFGDATRLDPVMVAKVKALKPGERLTIDTDGDGKKDECWYIDIAYRHTADARPVLVRAIDEDGDLEAYKGPDLDSDLYLVDWKADGTVDAVIDYLDYDSDNDLDEMAMYTFLPSHRFFGKELLLAWWSRDDGDDNLLWYDVNYAYSQALCQYRCHFSGDETFVSFGLTAENQQWQAAYECPFLFYDPDGDTCSEVTLRVEMQGGQAKSIRYSFDADDDAFGSRTHDYDFSITAVADENGVTIPAEMMESGSLRGLPTQPWLKREAGPRFATETAWQKAMLTWDEINANTEGDVQRDSHERWEGLITLGSDKFPQVGGPACSAMNKRFELAVEPKAPLRLYYQPADRRLHLRGADEGWLHVDYNLDGQTDAIYTCLDSDKDGVFDRRQIDLDADGTPEFDWAMAGDGVREVELDWPVIRAIYVGGLREALAESQAFIDVAKEVLAGKGEAADPVEQFFLTKLADWAPETGLGKRVRETPAGARFYMDLVRDRLLLALKKHHGSDANWATVEKAYAAGDYRTAAGAIRQQWLTKADTLSPGTETRPAGSRSHTGFRSFTRSLDIVLDNRGQGQRENWPVCVPVKQLLEAVKDFNAANCAVVAPHRWLDWRQVAHQVDEIDSAVGTELSFVADIPADEEVIYRVFYSPTGTSAPGFPHQTSTAEDWVPPNIGWESRRCAYRTYFGQFDFFGKTTGQLIYDDIGNKSYHSEEAWGIDALHVGEASGLGGLTLYVDGRPYPVQNPAGKGDLVFTKRQLVKGAVRAAIEIEAANIIKDRPEVKARILCTIYAGRQETEIRVKVDTANGDEFLAPGLVKLPREEFFADENAGVFGSWGWQETVIGDIGMGMILAPAGVVEVIDLPAERRVQSQLTQGGLRYWIIGDWRPGRQHPVAPTMINWRRELGELAGLLLNDVSLRIEAAHDH